jgi:hypothetical protein
MRVLALFLVIACVGAGCAATVDSTPPPKSYALRMSDVVGIDPVSRSRAPEYTEAEVVDLTLLNIVKQLELVRKLDVMERYGIGTSGQLSESQRQDPDRTVNDWPEEDKELYYRAGAIVIEAIKKLNPDLGYQELLTPGREIMLPDPSLM